MATKRRVSRRRSSARGIFALALIGFVAVASIVILRRVVGVKQQTDIRKLEQQREALEAQRIRLESEIRDASSRQRLQPIAEQRLNMHIATPQEIVNLTARRPSRPTTPHDSL